LSNGIQSFCWITDFVFDLNQKERKTVKRVDLRSELAEAFRECQ
jgi:hypothetical protein